MKSLASLIFAAALLALTGCVSSVQVPPGSLDYWHHTGTYGPFKDDVTVENAVKLEDGTFILGHYVGSAQWLGQGPTDEIRVLHVDGNGKPIAPTPASMAAADKLRAAAANPLK